ncbi:MAG: antibiotic biosynthesis monooxygenase family protein [Desulfobacterales bacterium]|nr:antibiotic biosynthesis monooxygenase family protein [Desulfobacterales bacterium]
MLAKILIKRRFKKGCNKEVLALLNEFRAGAMNQPGYISGETLVDSRDPQTLVVIGTWQDMDSWHRWKENRARRTFEAMMEIYQEGPALYEEYFLGVPGAHEGDE